MINNVNPFPGGYVLTGVLLSPGLGGFWSMEMLQRLQPFYSVAFGLVLFELGQRTDLGWLRRNTARPN